MNRPFRSGPPACAENAEGPTRIERLRERRAERCRALGRDVERLLRHRLPLPLLLSSITAPSPCRARVPTQRRIRPPGAPGLDDGRTRIVPYCDPNSAGAQVAMLEFNIILIKIGQKVSFVPIFAVLAFIYGRF